MLLLHLSLSLAEHVAEHSRTLLALTSAERFGRMLALFGMVFHGTSFLYIKGLKVDDDAKSFSIHPFLHYEPVFVQIYFCIGLLLASLLSFLYLGSLQEMEEREARLERIHGGGIDDVDRSIGPKSSSSNDAWEKEERQRKLEAETALRGQENREENSKTIEAMGHGGNDFRNAEIDGDGDLKVQKSKHWILDWIPEVLTSPGGVMPLAVNHLYHNGTSFLDLSTSSHIHGGNGELYSHDAMGHAPFLLEQPSPLTLLQVSSEDSKRMSIVGTAGHPFAPHSLGSLLEPTSPHSTSFLALHEIQRKTTFEMFTNWSGILSGVLACIYITAGFSAVSHVGAPVSSSILITTSIVGSFLLGILRFDADIFSANMALCGLNLIVLGLIGVCMTREISRFVIGSEERSPLLHPFEFDSIFESKTWKPRVFGAVISLIGGVAGACMLVPYELSKDATLLNYDPQQHYENLREMGHHVRTVESDLPHIDDTLTHLFFFLPSFALGALLTAISVGILAIGTARYMAGVTNNSRPNPNQSAESARDAALTKFWKDLWTEHPDGFAVFCIVIAGLVWMLSAMFTFISITYVGYAVAMMFFHSWMLIYSGWNVLLFQEVKGKSHTVFSWSHFVTFTGFVTLCLSMKK